MPHVIAISGSLREKSFNTMLLRAIAAASPKATTFEVASIREIPLYDADVEAKGIPVAVTAVKEKIAAADGLLIATPEHNGSMPGVLKNAIDWLSRPPADMGRVFAGKPVGLVGATPGPGATRMSQAAWLPVLRVLGLQLFTRGFLAVALASKAFDAEGKIVDDALRGQVEKYAAGFSEFVGRFHA